MTKILLVFGTRPEVIKLAPVIKELKKFPKEIDCKVCVTGQHRQMIDSLLELFEIDVDYDLNLMQANQSLEHITSTVLSEIGKILSKEQCDYLIVQGDTTTAMAASMAAFYLKVKIAHVEAGLRTWNLKHPFPEEANRRIIDSICDLYFAHTDNAKENLLNERVDPKKIEVTGNTVIDALLDTAGREVECDDSIIKTLSLNGRRRILMTAHRRENFGKPIQNICQAVKEIAIKYQNEVQIVYPVHLNPNIQECVNEVLGGIDNVKLTKPMDYYEFVQIMKQSYIILTDSGGLQEEAPSLGKPVLVLRETTERPEGVEAGCVEVIGTDVKHTVKAISELLDDKIQYERMSKAVNPYGDGKASERIVRRLLKG